MKRLLLIITKKNASRLIYCVLLLACLFHSYASFSSTPIEKRPQTATQPDGTVIHIFVSGDQYYHWLHDGENYTIVVDEKGYYVYAETVNNLLVPTKFIVGRTNPSSVRLTPGSNFSDVYIEKLRNLRGANKMHPSFMGAIQEKQGANQAGARFAGAEMNPLVFFISFKGESDPFSSRLGYNKLFNDNLVSLKNYYLYNSYNQLTITSNIVGGTESTIVSFQTKYTRKYFSPYNAATNKIGYKTDSIRYVREKALLQGALITLKKEVSSTLNLDGNGDGNIDMVYFVISGKEDAWGDLLWPHRTSLGTNSIRINDKMPNDYMMVFEAWHDVGLLCHETGHILGAPDFYRSPNNKDTKPVYHWDLMSNQTNPPQSMSAYTKWKYMGFISDIPEIKSTGSYTLSPLGVAKSAYKIPSTKSGEYFIVEYRKKTSGSFESQIPGSGLVIYRVNSKMWGNVSTGEVDPNTGITVLDELYTYRPGGINNTTMGDSLKGFFSSQSGRTSFGDNTSPNSFMSDGSLGRLNISNIGTAGNTITFYYKQTCMNSTSTTNKVYTNTASLPALTEAVSTISTSGNVSVPAGRTVTFRSAKINLKKGFHAYAGSHFSTYFSDCQYQTIPAVARLLSDPEIAVSDEGEEIELREKTSMFDLYPVPADQFITLVVKKDFESEAFVDIYNSFGLHIYHNPAGELNDKMVIDLTGFASGLYYLKVSSRNESSTKSFIVN